MSRPQGALLSGAMAALLLLGAGSVITMRSSEVSAAPAVAPGPAVTIPAPAFDEKPRPGSATAVFAGGCFWGVQGVYEHVNGVTRAVAGYAGGSRKDASYETVGSGRTGHAESVRITYDPAQISYGALLQIFFAVVADPTTLNAQGPDRGTQYRSAIFPVTPDQKLIAERYIAQLNTNGAWKRPIVTSVEPMRGFYPAEAYHQDYLVRKPDYPYIRFNDLPKVAALRKMFPTRYRAQPVLTTGAKQS